MLTQFFERRSGPTSAPIPEPVRPPTAEQIRAENITPTCKRSTQKNLRKGLAASWPCPEPSDTYTFADHLVEAMQRVGDACFLYEAKGSPIASMGASSRGDCVEAILKKYCAQHDYGAYEVLPAEITDGRRANTTTTDFRLKHKETGIIVTVEVKNARMTFDRTKQRWYLEWRNVKKGVADLILLCVEHFDHVDIYVLDKEFTGYSTSG
jgi:hypothetical protein